MLWILIGRCKVLDAFPKGNYGICNKLEWCPWKCFENIIFLPLGRYQLKKIFLSKTPSITMQDESMKINMTNATYPDYCSSATSTVDISHVGSANIWHSFHGSDSDRGTSLRMLFKFFSSCWQSVYFGNNVYRDTYLSKSLRKVCS